MWQIGETQNDLKLVKLEKTKQILYNSVAQMRDAIGLKIDLLDYPQLVKRLTNTNKLQIETSALQNKDYL